LRLFPHNLDKAAIDLKTGRLIDLGMVDGMDRKIIDWETLHKVPHIHAARSVILREKTGYGFSISAKRGIQEAKVLLRECPALWSKSLLYVFKRPPESVK